MCCDDYGADLYINDNESIRFDECDTDTLERVLKALGIEYELEVVYDY